MGSRFIGVGIRIRMRAKTLDITQNESILMGEDIRGRMLRGQGIFCSYYWSGWSRFSSPLITNHHLDTV